MISYFDAFESKVGRVVIRISLTEDPLLEEKAGGEGGEGKERLAFLVTAVIFNCSLACFSRVWTMEEKCLTSVR